MWTIELNVVGHQITHQVPTVRRVALPGFRLARRPALWTLAQRRHPPTP